MTSRGFLKLTLCILLCGMTDGRSAPNEQTADQQFDKFAWQLFIAVNRPVNNNSALFWETWATSNDVFEKPNETPKWENRTQSPLQLSSIFKTELASGADLSQQTEACLNLNVGQEVRLNEPTFRFIVDNNLYYIEGQVEAARKGLINFPSDSIEIKAYWDTIGVGQEKFFYTRTCPGKSSPYGLLALHITSKAVPEWTWATFEHISAGPYFQNYTPQQCVLIECRDQFGASHISPPQPSDALRALFKSAGMEKQLDDTWKYYRLVGTQSTFVTPDGRPTHLGNSVLEKQFGATSSCITCHSRASISIENGQKFIARLQPHASANESFNGAPSSCWYLNEEGLQKFGKLDFVWSLWRAKYKNGDSFDRCGFVLNDCSDSQKDPAYSPNAAKCKGKLTK